MARGIVWGILATLVVASALGTALFLPPAPAQGPMKIWEAFARGYATIEQVDITYEHAGIPVTLPVGYKVSISSAAPTDVVVDENVLLMSPSPAQGGVDPNDPTTQDGALTTATIPPGSSIVYSYADEWLQGYLPAPPWWCTEQYQEVHSGVFITLGGEILPFAMQDIIANPYHDSDTSNSQNDVWNYMKTHPTIVVGKTPLWKEIPNTAGEILSVAVSATNLAVRDDNDGIDGDVDATGAIISDTIPAGWTVVPGSYSVTPTSESDNPDGSKLVTWVVDIPAADVTRHTDYSVPTPYNGLKLRYQLETPQLSPGRIDLPRAEVDTDHDETIDAHSAIPVLDVFNVNTAPTAALGGPYNGVEGSPITFDASGSSDPEGDALQYRWDFQNDGAWDTVLDPSPTTQQTFGDDTTGTVAVEVFDGEFTSVATASFSIANAAPLITSVSISSAEEGSPSTITVEFSDPGWLDTHTAFLDWGTGEMDTVAVSASHDPPAAMGTFTITHTYGDDFTYAGVLVLVDDDGGSAVQDLAVPVTNVAPTIGDVDIDLFVQAQVCLRVAGNSWNTVRMDLFEDATLLGSVSVTRTPGSPNDQAKCVAVDLDLLSTHTYRADVTFEPKPGAKKGADSVWVLVLPMGAKKINPGHALLKFHHVFHVGDTSTYLWSVSLPGLAAKVIGGCGCDDQDDDHDDCGDDDEDCGDSDGDDDRDDDQDDDCGDSDDGDGCDDDHEDDCAGSDRGGARDGEDDEGVDGQPPRVIGGDGPSGSGSGDDGQGACAGGDREISEDDDGDPGCAGSDTRCGDEDDKCSGDDDCGEKDDDEKDCGTVEIHIRVTATDPGTDDLTFTWTLPDGAVETHTFFNDGLAPDPRPSSLGVRPMTATDTLVHSLRQPCGKQVTLTVTDDDGGVATIVLTIRA